MTAQEISNLYGCLSTMLSLRLLRRRSSFGTTVLGTLAQPLCIRSFIVWISTVINRQHILVTIAVLASMLAFLSSIQTHLHISLFNLCILMCGHRLFTVIPVTNTMLCSLMLTLIIFGLTRFDKSLMFLMSSVPSLRM